MAAQGPRPTYFAAATGAADDNRFVTTANMKVGAYTLAATTMPSPGARRITVDATAVGTADTMGTLVVVGTDLDGNVLTETLVPDTGGTVTGSEWFASLTSVTGAGWAIDGVEASNDTLIVGCTGAACVADTSGVLNSITIGETAAGAITLADSNGTIAVLKASIAEGTYELNIAFEDYLTVIAAAGSKFTISTS